MSSSELLREALRALRANALRSGLTLLGIIIGVGTLVGVISVIAGLDGFVKDKVIQLAPDVYVVQRFGIIRSREEFLDALKRRNLDWNDYEIAARSLRQAEGVAAEAVTNSAVKRGDRRLPDVQVQGTTANFGPMLRLDIVAGRFFAPAEDQGAVHVAIIGADVKDELFPQLDPLGREVLVGGSPYRVIGLLEKQGRVLGEERDRKVFIPIQAFRRQFGSRESLNILIKARGGVAGVDASVDEVRALLRALRHTPYKGPDPFGVVTAESLTTLWRQISAAAFILSLLIASVSLGVGGIVIMNIMLVAVVERTREIGVRLALGARKRDVRRQFLAEAALLSLAGGLVGVVLGSLAAFGVRGLLDFPAEVTPGIVGLGIVLAVGVGLAAGYWPARNASNLAVVDALRAEMSRRRFRFAWRENMGFALGAMRGPEAAQLPDPARRDGGGGHRHHDGELRGRLQQRHHRRLHVVRRAPRPVPEVRAALRPKRPARGAAQPPRPHHRRRTRPQAPFHGGGGRLAGAIHLRGGRRCARARKRPTRRWSSA